MYSVEARCAANLLCPQERGVINVVVRGHREVSEAVGAKSIDDQDRLHFIQELEKEMHSAAESLEFEKAAALRDQILHLRGNAPAKTNTGKSRRGRKGRSQVPRPKRK